MLGICDVKRMMDRSLPSFIIMVWSSNYMYIFFFFFQAEDGIRDVERSRGLGDVYKRQDYWGI